jgi:hypothetical protein
MDDLVIANRQSKSVSAGESKPDPAMAAVAQARDRASGKWRDQLTRPNKNTDLDFWIGDGNDDYRYAYCRFKGKFTKKLPEAENSEDYDSNKVYEE